MFQRSHRLLTGLALVSALSTAGLIGMSGAQTAWAEDDRHDRKIVLPGNAVFPEGVTVQASTGEFFVGSTTDGTIFHGKAREDKTARIFSPPGADGRTTAVGMKVDRGGRLFVSGGSLGQVFVYDTSNASLLAKFSGGLSPTFINDDAIAPNGDVYFTDSLSPAIYRLSANLKTFERFTDFAGTPVVYGPGFNLNGIDVTRDGRYLISVQSNVGKLFRIDLATKAVLEINLNGANVTNGDGILLIEHRLYVMRNANGLLLTLDLSDDFSSAELKSVTGDPDFQFPTTFARFDDRFLVVNSQFDKTTNPVLPFNLLKIAIPDEGNGKLLMTHLLGANEVGGGDPNGTGTALVRLVPNKGQVCFRLSVQGVVLPAILSHIHAGAAGVNGPVVVDFMTAPDAQGRAQGCVSAALPIINGIWSDPAGYYVNVHTTNFPKGALRGQLAQRMNGDGRDDGHGGGQDDSAQFMMAQ